MLSRSSWRAARVLRSARGLSERSHETVSKQQPPLGPKTPAQCTCFSRHISSDRHVGRRRDVQEPTQEPTPLFEVKIADVKGKGREQKDGVGASSQDSDHLPLDRREGRREVVTPGAGGEAANTSSSRGTANRRNIDPVQAESWLMTALANPSPLQARETWNSYQTLPLDRRKNLPLHVYSQLARVQKTLQLKRRGTLWSRLSSIYEVWQERQAVPVEELRDTIRMLRYWFEQKEVILSSRAFSQARRLCCEIAKLLSPYSAAELLEMEQLADLVNDYGTNGNLKTIAVAFEEALSTDNFRHRNDGTQSDDMQRLYTKVISRLAQRGQLEQALQTISSVWRHGIRIDVDECGRNIIIALFAFEADEPDRLQKFIMDMEKDAPSEVTDHPFHEWSAQLHAIYNKISQMRQHEQEADIVALLAGGSDETKVALIHAKSQMRRLLSSAAESITRDGDNVEHEPSTVVNLLHRAMEAMKVYDEYLARGHQADRELYRLARMAKKRTETHSTFSPSLREAALLRVESEHNKQVRNFKKKWLPPKPITAHSETVEAQLELLSPESSSLKDDPENRYKPSILESVGTGVVSKNQKVRNPYADAEPGQILHLAIELGDYELARAILPVVMEDATFIWTHHDDDRALSLLKVLIRDANRPDVGTSVRRHATHLASAFYVRWQEDLARDPESYVLYRKHASRQMRSPAFLLIRLFAHQQDSDSFVRAMQVLVQDPSVKLAPQHLCIFAKQVFRSSRSLAYIAFKLYMTKDALSRNPGYKHLKEELERAISDPEVCQIPLQGQAYIYWCRMVLQLMHQLGITPRWPLLKDVVDMYEGLLDTEHDGLASYIVAELRKGDITPASGMQEILVQTRLRSSSSAVQGFLLLLEEQRFTPAVARAEEIVNELLGMGRKAEAIRIWDIFAAVSEQNHEGNSPNVKEAIETVRLRLASQPGLRSASSMHSQADVVPSPTSAVQQSKTEETPGMSQTTLSTMSEPMGQREGFLSDFFSDSHHTRPEQCDETARQVIPEGRQLNEAAVGLQIAVGPEVVQVAAASVTPALVAEHTENRLQGSCHESSNNRATFAGPVPSQAYSTLAGHAKPSSVADVSVHSPNPSILHELSQLPQQFADLTMEQVLALKRRCEIEMNAVRRKDEQIRAARRIALSRADASRWQGWQEFQATPWY